MVRSTVQTTLSSWQTVISSYAAGNRFYPEVVPTFVFYLARKCCVAVLVPAADNMLIQDGSPVDASAYVSQHASHCGSMCMQSLLIMVSCRRVDLQTIKLTDSWCTVCFKVLNSSST